MSALEPTASMRFASVKFAGESSFKEGDAYVVRNLYREIDVSNCRGPVAGRIIGKAVAPSELTAR